MGLLVFALTFTLGCNDERRLGAFADVRLGMTADEVRSRFSPGGAGAWRIEASPGGEAVLTWGATAREPVVRTARFEIHGGILVAVRALVRGEAPKAHGPAVEASHAVVVGRRPEGSDLVTLTILARDCPTHADEARALAASAPRSGS